MERALSWDEDQCAEAVRRTSDLRLKQHRAGRAQTLDLSPNQNPMTPLSPTFGLDDTVFEVDEEKEQTENDPLLHHMNSKSAKHDHDSKHVTFQTQSSGSTSSKDTTDGPRSSDRKVQSAQSESHHGGPLLRQDAMKESDIEMQGLSKKTPDSPKGKERKKSV